jgi:hypothetical protein
VSDTEKRWPCKLAPDGLKQCWALDEVLEIGGQGMRYQGLKLNTMINMTTHKFARHLVVLKSGKHGKKGIVLNLCPFCGGDLVANAQADIDTATQSIGAESAA